MSLLTTLPEKADRNPACADPDWIRSELPEGPADRDLQPQGNAEAVVSLGRDQALADQRVFRDGVLGVLETLRKGIGEPGSGVDAAASYGVEWLDRNGLDIFALAPTHDSAERAGKGMGAWFDATATVAETATYDDSAAGIVERPLGTGGEAVAEGIRLYEGVDLKKIPEIIAHEVQHLVVLGEEEVRRPEEDAEGRCAAWARDEHFAAYHSEFEAYWSTGTFPPATERPSGPYTVSAVTPSGERLTRTLSFDNARQEAIFVHMCGPDRGDHTLEDPIPYAYVPYFTACDPTFAGFVEALTTFDGLNALNSVRIEALRRELEEGGHWELAADKLYPDERAWLLESPDAAGFWAFVIDLQLDLEVRRELSRPLS